MAELRLSIGVDTKQAIRETKNLGKAMDALADDFEAAARDGDVAVEDIIASMRDLARQAKVQGNKAGDNLAKGVKSGADEATEEVAQSGREAAASFGGGFEDVADFVQESLANALVGFGPAGAAAGIALAAGVGIALSSLLAEQERLETLRDTAGDLAQTLYENKGVLPMERAVESLFETLAAERGPGGVLESIVTGFSDLGTQLDNIRTTATRTSQPVGRFMRALSGRDIRETTDLIAELQRQIDDIGRASSNPLEALFEQQPIRSLITQLETVRDTAELAKDEAKLVGDEFGAIPQKVQKASEDLKSRIADTQALIEDIGGAWQGAATDASAYFETTDSGLLKFNETDYLAEGKKVIAARDTLLREIVTVPDDIQAEAGRVLATAGAEAAVRYVQGYKASDKARRQEYLNVAKANGDASATQFGTSFTAGITKNDVPKQPVEIDIHDAGYQAWKAAAKKGITIPLKLSYDPNLRFNVGNAPVVVGKKQPI